jgi:hypothetical protein
LFLRSDFSSSSLVRLLGPWAAADVTSPPMDISERLGLWVSAFDAIGLQSAHQSIRAIASPLPRPRTAPPTADGPSLRADVQRARAALAHAVARSVEGVADADAGYAPFQRRHSELQRQMDMMLRPLRDHVRQALAQTSASLRQLAALDAMLEQMLAPREQAVMPEAAALLERRFKQCRAQHAAKETPADAAPPTDAGQAMVPSTTAPAADATALRGAPADPHDAAAWRATFQAEWRAALLAELDLRLEPIHGLVEALCNERQQNDR